jgi:hypothetical protein
MACVVVVTSKSAGETAVDPGTEIRFQPGNKLTANGVASLVRPRIETEVFAPGRMK